MLKHKIKQSIKPASGFASLFHTTFQIALPVVIFILVRLDIGLWLPILVIMLSKWRIFAVRPRFWPANLRANSVDIIVGIAVVIFMSNSGTMAVQAVWALLYAVWLLVIKPRSGIFWVSLQAGTAQLMGLMALLLVRSDSPLYELVLLAGLTCYLSARHFFDSFSEPYAKMLAYLWGYFAAALMWVLGHMLIVYPKPDGVIAMPVLMLSAIGYSLAAVYYLEHFDRLSKLVKREFLFLGGAVVAILVISLIYEGTNLIV